MRGIALMSEERPTPGQKTYSSDVVYSKVTFKLQTPPKIVILRGNGFIDIFHYYDTRHDVPAFSMSIRHLTMDEFHEKKMLLTLGGGKLPLE